MAIVNELGMEHLCAVMGSGTSTVSLAACHLLQVMFEALTEGMKKDIRGKDEAILPGEFGLRSCLSSNWLEMKVDPSHFFSCVLSTLCAKLPTKSVCMTLTQSPLRSCDQCCGTLWKCCRHQMYQGQAETAPSTF